jgi:proteasome accessory factor C
MSELHDRLRTLLFLVPYVVRHRGVPIDELTSRLGIPESQLMKEIDFLLMVGRPPFFPDDMLDIYHEGGKVYVDLHQSLEKPPRLTVFEALALAAAAQLFANESEMGEAAVAVRVALDKIVSSLPAEAQKLFNDLSSHFLILSGSGEYPYLETLYKAVDESREVELEYFTASRGEVSERTVRPYGLHHRNGMWYLAAYCLHRKADRVFRLSRVRRAELTDRIFDPPPGGFDVEEFVGRSLTVPSEGTRRVVLRFDSGVARWVRERWSPEYLSDATDGSVIARLHDVSDEYVLSYVASFGGQACIEEPAELAEKLAVQAQEALAQYQ